MSFFKHHFWLLVLLCVLALGCSSKGQSLDKAQPQKQQETKKVVYQVFTRLFGNNNTTNKPWGTLKENGVGKFNDFTDKALSEIKQLGVTHVWYTGVLHHNVITDYTAFGISNDDPDVVKGRAGSPYAVKDYYNVNPDLAVDVSKRLQEFEALIKRSHAHNLKVIIDIVPNHVARNYNSLTNPKGVVSFGATDNTKVAYSKNNNFYYVPNTAFKVPDFKDNYVPLNGEFHPLADKQFDEFPAKWTGNGARSAKPSFYDWYETVKINHGVTPDGVKEFDVLPESFKFKTYKAHYKFWQHKSVPDSWVKFKDIAIYWLSKGVDGFRFDMAEMVPVEFFSYLNSTIKMENPNAFLLAEVYNPKLYRTYIKQGKMDYLYDKVQLYDTIKNIMQGKGLTDHITPIVKDLEDIEHHMLHFLENHDEQRIASKEFAGNAKKGMPAMVVSATLTTAPTLLYFAQELGEDGSENAGFGKPSRTSIFDYVGVPSLQRWTNNNKFDGGKLLPEEKELRAFYKRLLNFTIKSTALMGKFIDVHEYNRLHTPNYSSKVYSFLRYSNSEKLLICSNFNTNKEQFTLELPKFAIKQMQLADGTYTIIDQLNTKNTAILKVTNQTGFVNVTLAPNQSFIFKI